MSEFRMAAVVPVMPGSPQACMRDDSAAAPSVEASQSSSIASFVLGDAPALRRELKGVFLVDMVVNGMLRGLTQVRFSAQCNVPTQTDLPAQ